MKIVSYKFASAILFTLSMLLFALRGNLGAIVITILALFLLFNIFDRGNIKVDRFSMFFSGYLFMFAFLLNVFRSKNLNYYMVIGYFAVTLVLLNNKIQFYDYVWNCLRAIALIEAFGVYLQFLVPNLYYALMSVVLPDSVVSQIQLRLTSGYYTGFTREVSYTMFLIAIGLGLYIFDVGDLKFKIILNEKIKKYFCIIFLFGALFISGKRATLLFFVAAVLAVYFLASKSKMKYIKYICIGSMGLLFLILTYEVWIKIPALHRIEELINYIKAGDIIGITNGRTDIYMTAIELWKEDVWFGIGWGNFRYSVPKGLWYSGYDVHNCYLQVLCECGIIGLIPFVVLIIGTVFNLLRCLRVTGSEDRETYNLARFVSYVQMFFIMYSLTEPILYEYTDYVIYFGCVNLTSLLLRKYYTGYYLKELEG